MKTLGKEEIARNEQFLLFPQCFLIVLENFLPFSSNLKLSSANPFSMVVSEICRLGKVYVAEVYNFVKSKKEIQIYVILTLTWPFAHSVTAPQWVGCSTLVHCRHRGPCSVGAMKD